jgi:trehalose-phosphatase
LPNAHYAGNHGLEIEGPGVHRIHPEAADSAPALAACVRALRQEFADEEAVLIEDKTLTLSVHFRLVADEAREQAIRDRVARCCGGHAGLRLTAGKKVVEIRPDVPWDKGRATRFLVDTLLADAPAAPVLYIGDDRTDEDAFVALRGRGDGIIVAQRAPEDSAATAWLRSPEEVATFLERLAANRDD